MYHKSRRFNPEIDTKPGMFDPYSTIDPKVFWAWISAVLISLTFDLFVAAMIWYCVKTLMP